MDKFLEFQFPKELGAAKRSINSLEILTYEEFSLHKENKIYNYTEMYMKNGVRLIIPASYDEVKKMIDNV